MKNQKLNELTKKYFIEQKIEEVIYGVFGTIGFILFFIFMGSLFFIIIQAPQDFSIQSNALALSFFLFFSGIFFSVFLFLLGGLIFGIIISTWHVINEWLKSNWRKAEARAKKDLKIK